MRVTIPITILNSNPVPTPVGLVRVDDSENILALGVQYSDDTIKVCTMQNRAIAIEENTVDLQYQFSGCNAPNWNTTNFGDDYDLVEISTGWNTCSIVDNHPDGALYFEIDGVRFISPNVELTENEGTGYVDFNDFQIMN